MKEAFVLIGTPCYGGLVTHVYLQSILRLMARPQPKVALGVITVAHDSLITRARNTVVANFLDIPTATHLMFIDGDIGFEADAFYRLLNFDADLSGGSYPLKIRDWNQVRQAVDKAPADARLDQVGLHYVGVPRPGGQTREGFHEATHVGSGFMMIKRATLERMLKAYPETRYKQLQTYPIPAVESPNQYSLFDCMIDPISKIYMSEDYTFCHRWRQIGGTIWLDGQSRLTHVGSQEFHGQPLVHH
jgi:hypothetical protein